MHALLVLDLGFGRFFSGTLRVLLALFVCFGPVDTPRYACAVIVEHGMAGGATAGPIGRDVLLETMKRDPSRRTDNFRKMASR